MDWSTTISLDERHAAAWYNRSNLLFERGKTDEAIEGWTQAIKIQPDLVRAWNNRGLAWAKKNQFDKAIEDFETAVKLSPRFTQAVDNLAWQLATCPNQSLRDVPRALRLARQGCELTDFQDWNLLSTLAATFAESGDYDEAVRWASKSLRLAPQEEKAEITRIVTLYKSGQSARN